MASPPADYYGADIRRLEFSALLSLVLAFFCFPAGLFFAMQAYLRSREFLTNVRGRELPSEELVRVATARAVAVMAIVASVVAPIIELALGMLLTR
jgi:hypothetical protein